MRLVLRRKILRLYLDTNISLTMHTTSSAASARVLVISDRAYRMLLAAYPAEFRQRYGPEMAQVFRTCCRASYGSLGTRGVLRLWLPTLWDWVWSAVGERFSSLSRRSNVYNIHAGRASSQLIPILFFLNACLILFIINPCTWVDPYFPFGEDETCALEVDNQSGKTLRVTPIYTDRNSYSAVRLYRRNFPIFPAYQQSNISVKYGDVVRLSYDCSQHGVSELYACDLEGECYVHKHLQVIYTGANNSGSVIFLGRYTFKYPEYLSRPDAALEAAVQSFPEHNYSGLRNVLLCFIQIIALIGGVFWLVRTRTIEIPKHDI